MFNFKPPSDEAKQKADKIVDKNFPFDNYRPHQKDIIAEILMAYLSGAENVVLEAPTGTGKSVIGITIANALTSSYFITAQKILQQQYLNDFPDLVDLKGRNAYTCWFMMEHLGSNKHHGCDRGQCIKRNKSFLNLCLNGGRCPYANQLELASKSPQVLFNFSSFLFQREMAGRFLDQRPLLVIDEAHSTESQVMNFVEVTISEKDIDQKLPNFDVVESYMSFFESINLSTRLLEKINNTKQEIEDLIGKPLSEPEQKIVTRNTINVDPEDVYFGDDKDALDDQELVNNLLKDMNNYRSALHKYTHLKEYIQNVRCVCEYDQKNKSVCIKPLYATYHTPKLLLTGGKNRLLMSATISNPEVFGASIGLNLSKTHYIAAPHMFPVQNRLIHLDYAGPMDYKSKTKTLPKLVRKIDQIMSKHANEKGIIHCQSFSLLNDISNGIGAKNRGRLLNQKNFKNKDELLQAHAASKNTVIIAPAMHEGLDLKNNLSRYQIIPKVPYPSMDNKQLKIRADENWNYYLWLVTNKLIQSIGRSVRSETDYASTYILDESFDKFFNMADRARLLPNWFIESLVID